MMKTMITPSEALALVLENTKPLASEEISLEDADGRTLAADIVSDINLPPFDNSAMDGYAVVYEDIETANETSPVVLNVTEIIAAGAVPVGEVSPGNCAQIMTGAPVPAGCNAVVMREETRRISDSQVEILASAERNQNIRPAGSDVKTGEIVMRQGEVIGAPQWGMLASLNYFKVNVSRQPSVAIITTGDELVAPGAPLGKGQIRDSNSFSLRGLLQSCGARSVHFKAGDDPDALRQRVLEAGQNFDAIVTSGGVSAGDFDPVRDVLPEIADVHFWKIAMKPGKPVMFATLRESGVPVFGLPGNPVSVMVSFEQFMRPALLKMQQRLRVERVELQARAVSGFRSPQGKVEYVRARVYRTAPDAAEWLADVSGEQGSGRLSSMTASNALLVIAEDVTEIQPGALVSAQMIEWSEV